MVQKTHPNTVLVRTIEIARISAEFRSMVRTSTVISFEAENQVNLMVYENLFSSMIASFILLKNYHSKMFFIRKFA
jgi:hypothetical protein